MGMIRRALIGLLLLAPLAFADEYSATGLSAGSTYRACGAWENEATPPLTATVVCSDEWATTAAGDTATDTITLQVTSEGLYSDQFSCQLTVGGVSDIWYVTTLAEPSEHETGIKDAVESGIDDGITDGI